ncbi:ribosomal protein L35 [Thecamonas trahens ATCC 50062]|uniref:Ribosomal protein L35 n=1 Tax=Thecamonas trahens ATCC 50062 TaxID=461836 RepID=A0A0L0DCC6_THETB|nr:ribosomal protein L35 [Thecamonas trahens ATCC 50062]KNC49890.1 ribosomal protein L35 [Thecamonas trahens ATCC 50062]|eukprot:XP_013757372.1 ribosomal protein L35 [Thecamonas trahens ATCC 50062]
MVKVKAHLLRNENKEELEKQLAQYRNELAQLRVAKVTSGSAVKLTQIRIVRKAIARVLTVISQKKKASLRKFYAESKYKPLDLRPKKTRAIRQALTYKQKNLKTNRVAKRAMQYPDRVFAVRA